VSDVVSLDLLALLAALLLLFLGAVVATRRGPNEYTADGVRGWSELARELDRSRRFSRSFSLIQIGLDDHGDGEAVRRRVERLSRSVRSIDYSWTSESALYVLLPETDGAAAMMLGTRIRETSPELMPERIAMVTFPEDGITVGALLEALDRGPKDSIQPWPAILPGVIGSEQLPVPALDVPVMEMTDDRGR
jgi:hypothetical protein